MLSEVYADRRTISSRARLVRSVRIELRLLLAFTVVGFLFQLWAILGEFLLIVCVMGGTYVTVFFVMRCVFAWVLWFAVLAICIWEWTYVRRHYSKKEWGSSLETLDSFEAAEGPEDADWAKNGEFEFQRGRAIGYRDPLVTPFVHSSSPDDASPAPPTDKAPDAGRQTGEVPPPHYGSFLASGTLSTEAQSTSLGTDTRGATGTTAKTAETTAPVSTFDPAAKARLARGDFILGPDVSSKASTSKQLPECKGAPIKVAPPEPHVSGTSTAHMRKFVPEDRYLSEKAQILQESFGTALCRTQSA